MIPNWISPIIGLGHILNGCADYRQNSYVEGYGLRRCVYLHDLTNVLTNIQHKHDRGV